jgi:hypothetical protein
MIYWRMRIMIGAGIPIAVSPQTVETNKMPLCDRTKARAIDAEL